VTEFKKILKYQISWKSIQWEPSCYCMRTDSITDRQRERHGTANNCFPQLCECNYKWTSVLGNTIRWNSQM